jgi:hypothetical protein
VIVWRRADNEALFAEAAPDVLCGESTVFYLYDRLRYRDLRATPGKTADGVCRFLGVATGVVTEVPRPNVRSDVFGRVGGPTPEERAAVLPRFADDVPRVAARTAWDLAAWCR